MADCERVTERRSSAQRPAGDAEADDIVEILNLLDNAGVLQSIDVKKRFFSFFIQGTFYKRFFNVFYFANVFYF